MVQRRYLIAGAKGGQGTTTVATVVAARRRPWPDDPREHPSRRRVRPHRVAGAGHLGVDGVNLRQPRAD